MMARWLDVAGSFRNNLQNKLAILHPSCENTALSDT
jgi:hypothetical protein